jgi:nucleoside-diphosphate-sugar epimerase
MLSERGATVTNVDIQPPSEPSQIDSWVECDIMDAVHLGAVVQETRPRFAVHLAARTDCVEDTTVEAGYSVNTVGTRNVLMALRDCPAVERVIVTSSQYVCGPTYQPAHVRDYGPHTVYGASKAQSEEITRSLDLPFAWTIIRPVNIWGPYHERYRKEAWRVIERGLYMHPGRAPVTRTYGYVGNVIWQVAELLRLPEERVRGEVFYVGDRPDDIYSWVDAFSHQLTGRSARVVPRFLVRLVALAGDLMRVVGLKPPLDSSRYRSMTSDYLTPMDRTFDLLGPPPYSLEEGVAATVAWLRGGARSDQRKHIGSGA